MSDPYFAGGSNRGQKRKRPANRPGASGANAIPQKQRQKSKAVDKLASDDEDIDSDFDDGEDEEVLSSDDAGETAAQKRLRLAKMYLDDLSAQKTLQDGFDAAEIDKDYITQRLQQQVMENTGRFHILLADKLAEPSTSNMRRTSSTNTHRLTVTAAVLSNDLSSLYTASKDGSVIRWNVDHTAPSSKRLQPSHIVKKTILPGPNSKKKQRATVNTFDKSNPSGHFEQVLSLSLSDDGTMLASAGKDKMLGVWSTLNRKLEWRKGLKSHKDTLSDIAFRRNTTQIYTVSLDRTLKIFDLGSMTYIDTLFGHQESILGLSVLKSELAVTAGGSDKSVRYWKVADEAQLVFRGGGTGSSRLREVIEGSRGADDVHSDDDEEGQKKKKEPRKFLETSIECVSMIDDTHFLSGGNSGNVSLWSTGKKKPIFTWPQAHGVQQEVGPADIVNPRWITSIASLPYSDLFVTGSWNGEIVFWQLDASLKSFKKLWAFPVNGVINSLQLVQPPHLVSNGSQKGESGTPAVYLVAGVGQEPRLGRWFKVKEGKNEAVVVPVTWS